MSAFSGFNRRGFIGVSLAATGAALVPSPAQAVPLDLDNPEDALEAAIRLRGWLDASDALWGFRCRVFAVQPGRAPVALFDATGAEIYQYRRQDDGTWLCGGHTLSWFTRPGTDEVLESWTNPVSGRDGPVVENVLVSPGYRYTTTGKHGLGRPLPAGKPPISRHWRREGDRLVYEASRDFPPQLPQPVLEYSHLSASAAEVLAGDGRGVAEATFSTVYLAPWFAWMGMEGIEGHMMWHGTGRKLASLQDMPAFWRAGAEAAWPEFLTAASWQPGQPMRPVRWLERVQAG